MQILGQASEQLSCYVSTREIITTATKWVTLCITNFESVALMRSIFPFTDESNRESMVCFSAVPGNVSQNENLGPPCELFL